MSSKDVGPAGFTFRDGDVFIRDSDGDGVFISESQVFQLYQRLQKEYEPKDENEEDFVEFFSQDYSQA